MTDSSLRIGFCYSALPCRRRESNTSSTVWACSSSGSHERPAISRRAMLATLSGVALSLTTPTAPPANSAVDPERESKTPLTGFQTRTGLKYFDFTRGEGPTPKWGDLVNIQYVAYTITPSGDALVKQDSSYDRGSSGYLIHHGNGEMIFGLEEAIHSMSAGGRRRAIIPKNIAYFSSNLGPVPLADGQRRKFSKALQDGDGTVVFDIELRKIMKDPMDRGYYEDLTPTPEEMMALLNAKSE